MSFEVVINGPVAIAGSIPFLSKMMGTKVPIKAAMMITPIMDPAMVRLMIKSCWIMNPKSMRTKESAIPLIKLKPISFINRFNRDPLTTLFANPWTMMAEETRQTRAQILSSQTMTPTSPRGLTRRQQQRQRSCRKPLGGGKLLRERHRH